MAWRSGGTWLLGGFLLWALLAAGVAPLTWDLPEPRGRAGKIRVHPRGNLWATGHFMGKKSLEPLSPSLLGTTPHTYPRDQQLQLSHDLLRSLLLRRALGMSLGTQHPTPSTGGSWFTQRRTDAWNRAGSTRLGLNPPREVPEWVPRSGFM